MTQNKEKWIKAALGLSTAFTAPQQGFTAENTDAQEFNKTDAQLKDYHRIPFWETEYALCDALIIAKHWNLDVNNAKSIMEDKVNHGYSYVVGTQIYRSLGETKVDLTGLTYNGDLRVSEQLEGQCTQYAEGLQEWYYGSDRPFTYCDAELVSVYYDKKLRSGKALLGNKTSAGLADSARTYLLNPAEEELRTMGYTGTSDFCSFDHPAVEPPKASF